MSQLFLLEIDPLAPAKAVTINALASAAAKFNGAPWYDVTHPAFGADPTGAADSTGAFVAATGGSGNNRAYYIPIGVYTLTGGGVVLSNPNSLVMSGGAAGLGSVLRLAGGTSPVLTFGDGTHEPFSATIRDLAFDANGNAANPTLYFRRVNIFDIENVRVKGFGAGVGLGNDPTLLFQEMYFRRLESLGDSTVSGICLNIAHTGNVNFDQCNLENALTGLKVRGQLYAPVTYNGGHIERVIWAIDAEDAQIIMYGTTLWRGQVWLGAGCHAGSIVASNRDPSIFEGGVSDLGFGNKLCIAGGVKTDGKAQKLPALNTDGTEWLRTVNVVDDPLFRNGAAGWTATNATITDGKAGMPGAAGGRSLMVQGTSANGYASCTFAAEASTDYLLSVAFIVSANNAANARVQVLDESSTSLYDSGTITYPAPFGSGMRVRIHRKRIPVAAGTGKQLTVRIYSVGTTAQTIVPLLLLSKSAIQMASQMVGGTQTGSGTSFQVAQDMSASSFFSFNSGSRHRGPCYVYFQASGSACFAGASNDDNTASAGMQYQLDTAAREYCLVLPSFPDDGVVKFYAFGGTGTLTLTDLCIVPICLPDSLPPARLVDGATVNVTLGPASDHLLAANGSRAIAAPTGYSEGKRFTVTVQNITVGAITTTWNAAYKLAGGAWTDPAAGKRRSITFRMEGATAYEEYRSSGDV